MAFMNPVIDREPYYEIETTDGTEFLPEAVCGILTPETWKDEVKMYCHGEAEGDECPERHEGFICRLSAAGYMDATDWVGFATEVECAAHLLEMYGDGDPPEDWVADLEKIANPSLKERLLAADLGLTEDHFGNHCSDLYVLFSTPVMDWLHKNHEFPNQVTTFSINKGSDWGKVWGIRTGIEIPFSHVER